MSGYADNAEHTCVYGLAWGDEGKGKVVDLLCPEFDLVVRYNGGANAGHTIRVDGRTFKMHLLPAGVLHEHALGVIGPGVVVDPQTLIAELDTLAGQGIDAAGRLRISDRAHVVMPYHKLEDRLSEERAAAGKIGTTSRGIGPCYADRALRTQAVRMGDLVPSAAEEKAAGRVVGGAGLEEWIRAIVERKRAMLRSAYGDDGGLDAAAVVAELRAARQRLAGMVCDTGVLLHEAMRAGKRLLFEGANGLLLDVDHGTYPYVTSSNTGPGGVASGAGVPPTCLRRIFGATKAYATRVGGGPFVSELADATGDRIREQGHEYGTTTGRPRRCGWFDAVAVRYSVRIGGATDVALMHLDTLSGFERVGICTAYEQGGRRIETMPADVRVLEAARPVFEYLPGWSEDIRGVRRFEDLPATTQRYVRRIEELIGARVTIASVGPGREETIRM